MKTIINKIKLEKLLLILLCVPLIGLGQEFGGSYSYEINLDSGPRGYLDIYPETDTSFIFCLDISRGAPSYNMGYLVGRAIFKNDNWVYYNTDDYSTCSLEFIFYNDIVEISTIDEMNECGYGHGVYSDGTFQRYSLEIPQFYLVSPYSYSSDTLWFKDY